MWRIGGRFAVDLWRFGQPDGDFGAAWGNGGRSCPQKCVKMGKVVGVDPAAGGGGGFGWGGGAAWGGGGPGRGGGALAECVWLAGMEVGLEIVVTMVLCIWKRK